MHEPDPLPKEITLPLVPNFDPELTCFVCKGKRCCELAIVVNIPGLRSSYGIHFSCVEHARKKNE